jgi:2,3-bisphosphoglycerate-dependent phosphoglycerate mutase
MPVHEFQYLDWGEQSSTMA